MAFVALEVY
jgi:hypothetical protein